MAEVMRTTLHPFSLILKIFSRIGAPIVVPPSDDFQICSQHWNSFSFPKKRCKPYLNKPTNADAISSWITQLNVTGTVKRPAWQTKKKIKKWKTSHFALSRRHASFDFHVIVHGDRGGPCHHCTTLTFLDPISSLAAIGTSTILVKMPSQS